MMIKMIDYSQIDNAKEKPEEEKKKKKDRMMGRGRG